MQMSENKKPYDIWRDSPLRFAGYCNEVGEAFAPIYPKFLLPSYILSVGYVLGDTFDKTYIAYNMEKLNETVCWH
jgi:mitochondrial fission process protein 1